MTNNSIFKRVLALVLCLVMFAGVLTSCFQMPKFNPTVGTITPNTPTGGTLEKDPDTDPVDPIDPTPVDPEPVDPNELFSGSATLDNNALIYGALANDVFIGGGEDGVAAMIPADVKVEAGASSLSLSIKKVEEETLENTLSNLDVHVSGIALDNTTPMTVMLGAILPIGLANTELKLYHIENGNPVAMMRVNSASDFAIHNQYVYDAETGNVTIYVASFSVFTAVKTEVSKWEEGTEADTSWYVEGTDEYTLADVADFLGFRDLVDAGNTFEGKTVILGTDIDLDKKPFDPIGFGYYKDDKRTEVEGVVTDENTVFLGTFDGGNHTIYNLYENCWELDPDKTSYSTYTYSTAGAGLFASIKNATIKNIAISGAEVVFECVDMGVVVGYAQGTCHFENIIVTNAKIANYNRYTGGVVGEVSYGPYGIDTSLGYSHTFKNITVDSSVTVSGLWGSFGCGMGGVIGGKWGDATVYMENVVSAPTMDVYNDVVSAYQWYAFRGCGMLIGHTEEPYSDGRHSGNATASFLTCENVNVYYGDWVNYNYYEFANQDSATGRSYPWVRAEEGNYCDAFSNIRYGVPTHNGVEVSDLTEEELKAVATDYTTIVFNQLYGADRGMYGTNKHDGVNVSYSSPKTFYIENNVGWKNLKLHYIYEKGEETWTTVPDGVELVEFNGVYRIDLPVGAKSFTITADGDYTSEEFIVDDLTEKETYSVHTHIFDEGPCSCGATKVDTWEKLTNTSELQVGDLIVFVYEKGKMELSSFSTTSTVYGIGTEFETLPNGIIVFEVVEGSAEDTIAFKNGDKYLCWESGNSLSMNVTLNANTSWTVSVDENGNATVSNAKDNTRKLQWNATSPRFACYTSSQAAISIYVKVASIQCNECVMTTIDHKDASCGVAGYTTTQCTVCGKVETTTTKALEHDYTGSNPYICLNNCGIHNFPEDGSTITIQEALWIAETLENGKETTNKYVITGVIDDKDHPSSTGATTITADEYSIYITNIHNADGTIRHDAFTVNLKDGDTIIVSAKIAKNDSGEVQLHDTWIAAHLDTNEDGTCDYCGIVFNASEMTETIKITGASGNLVNKVITWIQGDVAVSNAQGSSTSAILATDTDLFRVYAKSTFSVSAEGKNITKIIITCTSSSYATACKTSFENAGYTATVSNSVVTITFDSPVDSITVTASAQFRLNKVEVTYTTGSGNEGGETPACTHTNTTTTTVDATCTEAGSTTVTCDDCGATVSTTELPIIDHNYVDGTCSVCGAEDPNAGGSTEPTVVATFEFGENGSASHNDGSSKTSYSETNNGYTLNLTGGTNMYTGARDATGNSAIKLGSSSKTGGFSFTVPDDVTSVVIYIAKYKTNTTKITVNGTDYTLTNSSNDGAYDVITVDTTTEKTVTLTTVSGGVRAMVNTIEFYK